MDKNPTTTTVKTPADNFTGDVWMNPVFNGDGTSKLYASAGRFYFALPTDLNVRVFTANSAVTTFNYDPTSIDQGAGAPRAQLFQGGSASGEPVGKKVLSIQVSASGVRVICSAPVSAVKEEPPGCVNR